MYYGFKDSLFTPDSYIHLPGLSHHHQRSNLPTYMYLHTPVHPSLISLLCMHVCVMHACVRPIQASVSLLYLPQRVRRLAAALGHKGWQAQAARLSHLVKHADEAHQQYLNNP